MVVLPNGVNEAEAELTVTVAGVETALQPLRLVTVTVKLPAAATLIFWVLAPFDHRKVLPGLAERVTLLPAQKIVGPCGVIEAEPVLTVTAVGEDTVAQPLALVTVTVKVPALEVVMFCVVAPLDQR
jgi:hypothetical protein